MSAVSDCGVGEVRVVDDEDRGLVAMPLVEDLEDVPAGRERVRPGRRSRPEQLHECAEREEGLGLVARRTEHAGRVQGGGEGVHQGALAHAGGALQHDGPWPAGGSLVEPGAQQAQLS